jgi:hypothetical protein
MRIFYKLKNFFYSLFWHVSRGLPKSSQQTIDSRFNICTQCENFDAKNSQCLICGCNLSTKKIFLNKLAWSDQECPIGKWGSENENNKSKHS